MTTYDVTATDDVTDTSLYDDTLRTLDPYMLMGCDADKGVQTALALVAHIVKVYVGPVVAAFGLLGKYVLFEQIKKGPTETEFYK